CPRSAKEIGTATATEAVRPLRARDSTQTTRGATSGGRWGTRSARTTLNDQSWVKTRTDSRCRRWAAPTYPRGLLVASSVAFSAARGCDDASNFDVAPRFGEERPKMISE